MHNLIYLLLALSLSNLASAQTVYRSTDKDGNLVFSDTPTEGAEEVILAEVPIIKSDHAPVTSRPERAQEMQVITYTALKVTSPANDEADRKSTRLNSSHSQISHAVFC